MPAEPAKLALASDFAVPTREMWHGLVAAVLAKTPHAAEADVESALATTTYDDVLVKALYTIDDAPAGAAEAGPGRPPFRRGATAGPTAMIDDASNTGWDVRARHADPDPERTNRAVLDDLEHGATSLWLVLGAAGLPVAELDVALAGVYLDLAPITLDAGPDTVPAAQALLALGERRGVLAGLHGSLGADPIGAQARFGAPVDLAVLAVLAKRCAAAPGMRVATVDGTVYHEAGASDAQEIGAATAVGVAYLRALVDGGASIDDALATIDFRFAVTAEQFASIAKLRAARQVWDRVAELSGADAGRRGQYQHAVTSAASLTRRDPWVNMLRTTIGCFAAAIGGADAITVLPFDAAIGQPDDFARRIARNTHAVLHDESSLARVADAAGGSWLVESLTDELAGRAWAVFTALERAGGAAGALADGTIGALLGATRSRRAHDIAHRTAAITGVSEFAFVDEVALERPPLPAPPAGLLPRIRYAADFEALRDRADAHLARTGTRPAVFLATLGPPAAYSARAAFAVNLFQAAGLECVAGPPAGFAAAATPVGCLCSSDRNYADGGAELAAKDLRAAGASWVWLAGRGEHDGVDGQLFAGCDALAALRATLDALDVA